jgi:hypothetical protein
VVVNEVDSFNTASFFNGYLPIDIILGFESIHYQNIACMWRLIILT